MQDDTITRFRAAYWALVHHLDTLRLRAWEERGLTLPQLRILFYVRSNPGATTNALAKLLGLTAPTISGLVDKLAKAGLIARGQDPEDRRVIPLELTPEGHEVVGEIRQGNQAYLAALAEDLGDDLAPITAELERLATRIAERQARQESSQGALV